MCLSKMIIIPSIRFLNSEVLFEAFESFIPNLFRYSRYCPNVSWYHSKHSILLGGLHSCRCPGISERILTLQVGLPGTLAPRSHGRIAIISIISTIDTLINSKVLACERKDNFHMLLEDHCDPPIGRRLRCIVQYSIVQYSIVQYSILQYCIVQYSIVQYSIVQ